MTFSQSDPAASVPSDLTATAAVDVHGDGGDEAGLLGSQEQDGGRHVLWLADARIDLGSVEEPLAEEGSIDLDLPRTDVVRADTMPGPHRRHVAREALHAGLRHPVGRRWQ